jgi:hypothetical protein
VIASVGQRETVDALLQRSGRDSVPIRRSFVQAPGRGGGAGPLAAFVSQRRARALDLYLLLHAVASAPPYDARFPAAVWARALGVAEQSAADSFVSKSWHWLEDRKLIASRRRGRLREVTLLQEDGSGLPYRHPGEHGAEARGHYFKLPHSYWAGNFPHRMSLPGKAVLLIALSLRDDFVLPTERGARWYGLSRDTVRKGLRELRLLGLLDMRELARPAPLTALGYTQERHYSLRAPFVGASVPAASDTHDDSRPI